MLAKDGNEGGPPQRQAKLDEQATDLMLLVHGRATASIRREGVFTRSHGRRAQGTERSAGRRREEASEAVGREGSEDEKMTWWRARASSQAQAVFQS